MNRPAVTAAVAALFVAGTLAGFAAGRSGASPAAAEHARFLKINEQTVLNTETGEVFSITTAAVTRVGNVNSPDRIVR